jgi:hypothetical protein
MSALSPGGDGAAGPAPFPGADAAVLLMAAAMAATLPRRLPLSRASLWRVSAAGPAFNGSWTGAIIPY